mgnify:CR=1 FL=1
MAKDVAVKKETTVVAFDADILLADSGAGMEGMTQDDLMIPRLSMLQKVSDQVNKRHGAHIRQCDGNHNRRREGRRRRPDQLSSPSHRVEA